MAERFPFDFDGRFMAVWWTLGARPAEDGVVITDDGRLEATYGRFAIRTTLDNVASVESSGPYNPLKSVGLRLSLKDSGLTMGTTSRGGACLIFKEKVTSGVGFRPHRGLTVTVADPDGFVAAVQARLDADPQG